MAAALKGRYELKDALGRGGMGVVYRAYDRVLKCDVAVKTLRDSPDPTALQLFYRECEVLSALNHPNIVPILDIGEFEEEGQSRPYFVMPLLPGTTLDKLIRSSGTQLTVSRRIEILAQVCRGLHGAHERGLIHRDIKPGNILVMPDYSAEIIDFGVAHMINAGTTAQKGTLYYMAPELFQGQPPSVFSDIFALGATAFELFTRRRPFERPTEREIIEAILHEIPPPASDLDHSVNEAISRVIHKAMAKQPWHRFSTVREFSECLEKAHRGEPIEYFDTARIRPRMERARAAFEQGDQQFAAEIVSELEAEGHLDPDLGLLKRQIDIAARQKRIRQLLESARSRLEGEEYPLALQKVQEILTLDPDNAEAIILKSRIEGVRSEKQIDGWLRLARQHIENNAFSHAREALENVLQIRPRDARAAAVSAEVDRREQEFVHIRKEKEQLYQAAVEAYQRGDFSSAMTKLERVLDMDRRAPDSARQELGNAYRNFYNQVRSEYDAIQGAYAEARKHLENQNCAAALAICERHLLKYPDHALFQGLKFDVQEQQRLQLSGYIADVDRQVEAETDLERKVNIIRDAVARFPDEPHFAGLLRIMTERLDLVTGIIAKARYYEERMQFAEALTQWEILRSIHSRHPGLQFEIERLGKRLAQQVWEEGKARHIRQIDMRLEEGEFDRAIELAQRALQEYPADGELLALQQLAIDARNRAGEAQTLMEEGERLFESGQFEDSLAVLHKAQEVDARCGRARPQLLDKLVARAQQLIDIDPPAAERFAESAFALDPSHAGARDMHRLLLDLAIRRQFAVEAEPGQVALHPETREFQPVVDTVLAGQASRTEILPSINGTAVALAPEPRSNPPSEPAAVPLAAPRKITSFRWIAIGSLALFVVLAVILGLLFGRHPIPPAPALVAVEFHIAPAGASVYLRDKIIGTSGSQLRLPPGNYSFQIAKEGYESKIIPVELRDGTLMHSTEVALDPLPQKLSFTTDLKGAKVSLDGAPVVEPDLNGDLLISVAAPGKHTLQVESGTEKASISFETQPLAQPEIAKPDASTGLDVVLVSSYRGRASIQSTLGAVPVRVEDRDSGALTSGGLELNELAPGSHDLTLGTGARAWNGDFVSGPVPSVSLSIRSGVRMGMIVVDVPRPDGSQIMIDNVARGVTKNGTFRRNVEPGIHTLRVTHEGYVDATKDGIVVQKGGFVRVPIFLTPRIDVTPSKMVDALPTPTGNVILDVSPVSAKVKYQHIGDPTSHQATSTELVLETGNYLITASAQGYADQSMIIAVQPGTSKTASLNLPRLVTQPAPEPVRFMDPKDWDKPWTKDGDWFSRTGGDFVLYNPAPASGVFHFMARSKKNGGKIRWVLNYLDAGNYILYELDKNYSRNVFRDGKRTSRVEMKKIDIKLPYYEVELSVTPNRIAVKLLLDNKNWDMLDDWDQRGLDLSKGRFGFQLSGDSQVFLKNFSFAGKRIL